MVEKENFITDVVENIPYYKKLKEVILGKKLISKNNHTYEFEGSHYIKTIKPHEDEYIKTINSHLQKLKIGDKLNFQDLRKNLEKMIEDKISPWFDDMNLGGIVRVGNQHHLYENSVLSIDYNDGNGSDFIENIEIKQNTGVITNYPKDSWNRGQRYCTDDVIHDKIKKYFIKDLIDADDAEFSAWVKSLK